MPFFVFSTPYGAEVDTILKIHELCALSLIICTLSSCSGAATHSVSETPSFHAPVRSIVEAARGPESMSAEPAGPVPIPATPSLEEPPPLGDGPGCPGSAGPSSRGFPWDAPAVVQIRPCTADRAYTSQRTDKVPARH